MLFLVFGAMINTVSICESVMTFDTLMSNCHLHDITTMHDQISILKMVNKSALIKIVDSLSKNLFKNKSSFTKITKVLASFSSSYKINFSGNNKIRNVSPDCLNVDLLKSEQGNTRLLFCTISLPSLINKQITFNDLRKSLVNW